VSDLGWRRAAALVAAALCACGSKPAARPRHDGGDAGPTPAIDAAGAAVTPAGPPDGAGPGYRLAALAADGAVVGGGAIAVTVTWPDAPSTARISPGVSGCGRPRPPRAAIGPLHGVAGALVWIEGATAGKAPPPAKPARLMVRDCGWSPTVAVVPRLGSALELQAQDDAGHAVTITDLGAAWTSPEGAAPTSATRGQLAAWGHTVAVPLPTAGVRQVTSDRAPDDAAWVLVTDQPYAAVTADDGAIVLERVPAGAHEVVAWLPPAAGQPAQLARGTATVVAGDKVELALRFGP
jgi:hypothetical protein